VKQEISKSSKTYLSCNDLLIILENLKKAITPRNGTGPGNGTRSMPLELLDDGNGTKLSLLIMAPGGGVLEVIRLYCHHQ
jgi:hypothetical protein